MPSDLKAFQDTLDKCRFCPMCKPAGEVSNVTLRESHTTRARAMLLWRVAAGLAFWRPRDAELLYQCTLDSIAEAWCISHYAVSQYMAQARAALFEAGLAPAPVLHAVERGDVQSECAPGDAVFLASEAAELGDSRHIEPVVRLLERAGLPVQPLLAMSGALAYSLGARARARQQAVHVVAAILQSGATTIIADGPQTLWALRRLYPALDVALPSHVKITSLSAHLLDALQAGRLSTSRQLEGRALVHDSRSAMLLADKMAHAEVVQPGYRGPEERSGEGEVFETPRRLLDRLGMQRLYSVWSRSLCKSCGADDGLWLTYPDLAATLAQYALSEAKRLGASVIVADSLLCAKHLTRHVGSSGLQVTWLPELLAL